MYVCMCVFIYLLDATDTHQQSKHKKSKISITHTCKAKNPPKLCYLRELYKQPVKKISYEGQ